MNYILKKETFLVVTLLLFYLLTRLFHLTLLPIFTDEAEYIYWAKLIATTNKQWFISLIGTEPPLFIWSMVPFLKILPSYLVAGRMASVVAGLIGLIGIYHLTRLLFQSAHVAFLSGILFILTPFILFYDRLAAYDALLSSLGIWSIYFAIKSRQTLSVRNALWWGVFLGLTLLSKASGIVFLFLSALGFFIILPRSLYRQYLRKTVFIMIVAFFIAEVLHGFLFLSRGYHQYSTNGISRYTIPFSVLWHNPFIVFSSNIQHIFLWLVTYYTLSVFCLGIGGLVWLFKKKNHAGFLLLSLWLFPIVIMSFVGNEPLPRHFLFTTPYFLIAGAYILQDAFQWNRTFASALLVLLLVFLLRFDLLLLFNPPAAPLPTVDYNQYISGSFSGYGLAKVFTFLRNESKSRHITVVTLGTVSLYPYAFDLEFWNDPHVTVTTLWPVEKDSSAKIAMMDKKAPVYVVMKFNAYDRHENFLKELHLREILKANKPNSNSPILLAVPQ